MSKGDETRQRIVAKAAVIFNTRGFEGSSIQDVMEATGLEKGGIYRHFANKEELATAAFDYAWRGVYDARIAGIDLPANSVDKLKRFIDNFTKQRSAVAGGCPLLNTAIDSDDGNPLLRARAAKAFAQWRDRLAKIIREGRRKNEIRSAIVPKQLSTFIVGTLEGALMVCRLERDRTALEEAQKFLVSYLDTMVRMQRGKRS
jgi:TetR/AcrR family transcriptional repressor of nem operon